MGGKKYWIQKLFTRDHFARPLLNAAMFSWVMASLSLITKFFPNEMTPLVRWLLTGLLFLSAFYLYLYWDEAKGEVQEVVEEEE